MRVVPINQMTFLARVWSWRRLRFVWYRVGRSGEDWRPLAIGQKYEKPQTIETIAKKLKGREAGRKLPAILDEAEADRVVAKNTPKKQRT